MGSGFSSAPHPGLGGWGGESIQAESWKWCRSVMVLVMLSTRSPEGIPCTTPTTVQKKGGECCVCWCGWEGMGGGWKLPCLGCDLPFERGGDLVQLTRQLGPFDLGQSIDRDCCCSRQRSGWWVRGWKAEMRQRSATVGFTGRPSLKEKLTKIQ